MINQYYTRLATYEDAEEDGHLLVLPEGITRQTLIQEYKRACAAANEECPSPSWATGYFNGFDNGKRYILELLLSPEKKMALGGTNHDER